MSLSRVKYACLIILLSSASLISFGQNQENSININWKAAKKILDSLGNEINVLTFENAHYFGKNNYLPAYKISIPGIVTEFTIRNPIFEALTEEEQKIIASNQKEISLDASIEVQTYSGKPISIIYIIPLKGGAAGIRDKIISFNYSYQRSSSNTTLSPKTNNAFRLASSVNASVLSSGTWYKISINKSGIFKIDYNFLVSIGINPTTIDPRDIKIFGNGGGMLSQKNGDPRYNDLVENSIFVEGESDGSFDTGDYVLFYGQGPDTWTFNSSQKTFVHTKNIYSDFAYYFITIGPGNGLRIPDQANISGALQTINTFDERVFLENDNVNIIHSGREWYGDLFDYTLQKNFSFSLPGITANSYLKLTTSVMGQSFSSSSFTVSLNNQTLGPPIVFSALSNISNHIKGNNQTRTDSINTNLVSDPNLNIQLTYNNNGGSGIGYLNYLEINVKRDLKLHGSETSFRSIASVNQGVSEFSISNVTSSVFIWDITSPLNPKNLLYTLAGSQALFTIATDTLREFIAFNKTENFDSPVFVKQIPNQNLHGINTPDLPDLIIVTHPDLLGSANRLALFRKNNDNLDVEVVTTEQVYNEFSSGAQDITAIRDFVKMLYDRKSGNDSIRYLLLMGDGSYDYKNRINGNTNYVPIYESRQSLDPIDSHSSDDYFGFLDNSEGYWSESPPVNYLLDIGIGRLPVKNTSEADAIVNKIIHYGSSPQCQGKWRNKITLIADDGESNNDFLKNADDLGNIVNANDKVYNINKIYLDAYPQISSPGGETCPQAKEAITQAVEKGTFILNYVGHGGEEQLAQEGLVDMTQINNWENFDNLAFFITATCEFGRYDDPGIVSGAEASLLNSKGGSIALITSTRPVYANSNYDLNKAIYDNMFIPIIGNMPRMGDIIRLTKNNSLSGINNRNYALLGDPSMTLAFPKDEIVVTKINGIPILNDTLKALSTVTIGGEIRNETGAKMTDFNGSVYVTVYDKESTIQTFGTQGSSPTTFKALNNLIYEGIVTATNGDFNVTFVIPKDISYQFDKGKISLYAKKDNSLIDAHGYNIDIVIGGSDTNFVADNTPPKIKLFMNDESFVFGGLTGKNSLFLAKLEDDNGINIAGEGIGHEITASLDNSNTVIVLNEYYTAKKDNYKQGSVQFPFKDLSPGNHSIKFKCWDTYNNSSESYLEFIVANDAKIALDHVFNYPNPFSTHTTFLFDHNRAGDDIDVMVQVYSVSGKLIKTLDNRFLSSQGHISDIVWDGKDDFGDKIGKGVYVYKVSIRSLRDASTVFKYQKLVILN